MIWPLFVPIGLYTYIRGVDRDMFALELLTYRSKTQNPEEFFDKSMGRRIFSTRLVCYQEVKNRR